MELPCPWCDTAVPASEKACPGCGEALVVGGRFQIESVLGRGGMSTVYAAVDGKGRRVAAKVLRLEGGTGSDDAWSAWDLFERSCRVLRDLDHPGLPRVVAFERGPSERPVLVRERFDGGTLQERIDGDRRLGATQMGELARALLKILDYLHGRVPPVIHRDIKPANIMFRSASDWDPVLVDFDTVAAPEGRRSGLTIVATPGYTAPEQLAGDATPGSDLYSLGATLLHVATGTAPERLPRKHGHFELGDRLDELDPRLRSVLQRLLEPDPERRYRHAKDALADLDRTTPPQRTSKVATLLGGGIVVAAIAAVTTLWTGSLPSGLQDELDACQRGDGQKCMFAGYDFERGKYVDEDDDRARQLYQQACDQAFPEGCVSLAELQDRLGDSTSATASFRMGCERGHPRSCQRACHRIKSGMGVTADPTEARQWCERGCDAGDSWSCNDLGILVRDGLGGERDHDRAVELFDTACRNDDGLACVNLSNLVAPTDPQRAADLEQRACDLGYDRACRVR